MADGTTPNYNFTLPEVGGSDDSWGTKLNGNWSSVDGVLQGLQTDINTRLPKAGGTVTGELKIDTDLLTPLVFNARASDEIVDCAFRNHLDETTGAWVQRANMGTVAPLVQWRYNNLAVLTLNGLDSSAVFAGPARLPAGDATRSPLRITQGAAPTSPVNGDIWTTSEGVFARVNGVTYNLTTGEASRGELAVSTAGLSQATFQIPDYATNVSFTFGNVTADTQTTGLRLDFVSATGQVNSVLRHLFGATYAAPQAIAGAAGEAIDLDGSGVSGGYTGILHFERVPGGTVQWIFSGALRKANSYINLAGGRCILNETTSRTFRFRPGAGNFASNQIVAHWSM